MGDQRATSDLPSRAKLTGVLSCLAGTKPLRSPSLRATQRTTAIACCCKKTCADWPRNTPTRRALALTWARLPPAGSHQLAAGALTPRTLHILAYRDLTWRWSREA